MGRGRHGVPALDGAGLCDEVHVHLDALRQYGLSLTDVVQAAEASNSNASGGVFSLSGREVLIRGLGRINSLSDLENSVVSVHEGVPILLSDIAEIRIGSRTRIGAAAVNAEPAVVLSILKQPGQMRRL